MKPRTSALDRRTAMRLAATEYQRCAELLRSLDSQCVGGADGLPRVGRPSDGGAHARHG